MGKVFMMVQLEVDMDDFGGSGPTADPRKAVQVMVAEGNFEIVSIQEVD